MPDEFKKMTIAPLAADPVSGYLLELYVLGINGKRLSAKGYEIDTSSKSLVLEISCPESMNIEAFIEARRKFQPLREEQVVLIRENRNFPLVIVAPQSTDPRKSIDLLKNIFEELDDAGIKISHQAKDRISEAAQAANLDSTLPLKGGVFNLQNNTGRQWLQRELYPSSANTQR